MRTPVLHFKKGYGHSLLPRIVFAVMVFFAAASSSLAVPTGTDPAKRSIVPEKDKTAKKPGAVWRKSFGDAKAVAGSEYKSILAFFTSPDCSWCLRMKNMVFTDPAVKELLADFSLVEIDVTAEQELARTYNVTAVPVLIVLSADGEVKATGKGYMAPPDLKSMLEQSLNPAFLAKKSETYFELLAMLESGNVESNRWEDVILEMSTADKRKQIQEKLLKMSPFPKADLAQMLESKKLAVRIGVVEVIEEYTGKEWGFDPWEDPSAAKNVDAVKKIKVWAADAEQGDNPKAEAGSLTKEQILRYVGDLISGDGDRSLRALRMLEFGGYLVQEVLAQYLADHADLPVGSRNRIKEVQFIMVMKLAGITDPSSVSRKLLYGTMDLRISTIGSLQTGGIKILPVTKEFLADPDPMVREAAVDSMVASGNAVAVPILKEHLKQEKDKDVIYAVLKNLGRVRSNESLKILTSYLTSENEDIIIIALQSISRQKSAKVSDELAVCLADKRWRVRVAALEAVGELKLDVLSDKVADMLGDSDAFVRFSAIKAITAISAKKSLPKLEKIFAGEDELKAPVVAAICSMDIPVPREFGKALENKGPDTIVPVLDAVRNGSVEDLWLADKYLNDANMDIVCSAVRLLASKGVSSAQYRTKLAAVLEKGRRESTLALLESIDFSDADRKEILEARMLAAPAVTGGTNNVPAEGSVPIDDIMSAFGEAAVVPAAQPDATNVPPPAVPVALPVVSNTAQVTAVTAPSNAVVTTKDTDVFAMFEEAAGPADSTGAVSAVTAVVTGGESLTGLVARIEKCIDSEDRDIRFNAAMVMARCGNPKGIPVIQKEIHARQSHERQLAVSSLRSISGVELLPLIKTLLEDKSAEIRKSAAELCFGYRSTSVDTLETLLNELVRPEAVLKAWDIPLDNVASAFQNSANKRVGGAWARKVLSGKGNESTQNLAMMILRYCWKSGDQGILKPYFKSDSPWIRRMAVWTLGSASKNDMTNEVKWIITDPSEQVRVVLPALYSRDSRRWVHYLDQTHFDEVYSSVYSSSYDRQSILTPEIKDALVSLSADESPIVRFEAYLCQLENYEPVDLVQFMKTVESFPDADAAAEKVGSYLSQNYSRLGDEFAVLVPFMERSKNSEYSLKSVKKHFKIDNASGGTAGLVERLAKSETIKATYVTGVPETAKIDLQKKVLVYFTMPGCQGCEEAAELVDRVKEEFSDLTVETFDMTKLDSKRRNEVYCEKFGVPDNKRLVAPAFFSGSGYLIKTDVSLTGLKEMISRSAWIPVNEWHVVSDEDMAKADKKIEDRFSSTSISLVVFAGMLDGINPCAFATIIFLLSYLQVTRRKPSEIAQIGLAFIAGVFLAYFVMGLGLLELVTRIQSVLIWFRRAVNLTLAVFSLVIMILNIRDGILCLKGRLEDMTLQLPGSLKKGIHTAIRRGARHANFVIAAFVVGVVISVLELACTGQVYLPTIAYMLEKGGNTGGALGYLAAYNLSFILPLLTVFIIACFGLTSEQLTKILYKHAALVKFMTAFLFLVLFLYFLFGDKLQKLIS